MAKTITFLLFFWSTDYVQATQSRNVSAVLYFVVTVFKIPKTEIFWTALVYSLGPSVCAVLNFLWMLLNDAPSYHFIFPSQLASWCLDFLTNPCLVTVTTYKTLWHAALSNWAWFVPETNSSAHSFAIRLTETKDTFNNVPIDHVYLVQSVCHLSPFLYTYFSD